jgi:ABC-type sulfate/molybdate transport systems ATPase subunit
VIAIALEGLRVEADRRTILGPLSLTVAEGDFVLITGPSGSGKSTLLRAVAGLVRPVEGRIGLFGERASDGRRILVPPEQRRVGFLFQNGGLWPHLSVRRTLDFVLKVRRLPRAERERRIAELVALVGLAGLEDRRPGELSGGEAQRLGLARALAVEPRLLLLDEPLGPLDAPLRRDLVARLDEVHRRLGCTTLYVSHDPDEVAALATLRLELVSGRAAPGPIEVHA